MMKRFFVWSLVPVLVLCFVSEILADEEAVLERLEKLETEVKVLKEELDIEKAKEADLELHLKLGINEQKYVFGEYWDDGLFFETPGDVFNIRIGG